jgi:hypothetical protein
MHHHNSAESSDSLPMNHEESWKDYFIFGLIIFGVLIGSIVLGNLDNDPSLPNYARFFMGLFFLVFGSFKIINIQNFVTAYSRYDVIAKRSRLYAYIYPFLELTLALSYLLNFNPVTTNIATLILMSVSSVGVIRVLIKNDIIMCACLGTIIKLPVTKITLVEDIGMGIMAILMLIYLG